MKQWLDMQRYGAPVRARRDVMSHGGLVERLRVKRVLHGHFGCVNTVRWNATATRFVSSGDDTLIKVWDAEANFRVLKTMESTHTANVFCVRFLPASNDCQLVSCAGDHKVMLHDVNDGLLRTFHCHVDRVKRVCTVPQSPSVVYACSEDATVRRWDLREPHTCGRDCRSSVVVDWNASSSFAQITSLDVHPLAPHYVLAAGMPSFLQYDMRMAPRGDPVLHWERGDHHPLHSITGARYSHDGRRVLASFSDGPVYMFANDVPDPGGAHARFVVLGHRSPMPSEPPRTPPPRRGHRRRESDRIRALLRGDESDESGESDESDESDESGESDESDESDESGESGENDENMVGERMDDVMEDSDDSAEEPSPASSPVSIHAEDLVRAGITEWTTNAAERLLPFLLRERARNSMEFQGHFEAALARVPALQPCMQFSGHTNSRTVKDVNFHGPRSSFVASGSDDGNVFMWRSAEVGEANLGTVLPGTAAAFDALVLVSRGDSMVVNCIEGNPFDSRVLSCGIDNTVKVWEPGAVRVLSAQQCRQIAAANVASASPDMGGFVPFSGDGPQPQCRMQ